MVISVCSTNVSSVLKVTPQNLDNLHLQSLWYRTCWVFQDRKGLATSGCSSCTVTDTMGKISFALSHYDSNVMKSHNEQSNSYSIMQEHIIL